MSKLKLREVKGGEVVKIKLQDTTAKQIREAKEAMGVVDDSEDSFDKDYTVFRDLRD